MIDNISWLAIYPEIVLLVMACVIALVDLAIHSPRRTGTYVLTLLTLGVVALLEGMYASRGTTFYGFGNMIVSDAMGNWLKCFAAVAMMMTLVYGRPYAGDRDMLRGGELFTLSLFSLLGMFIMIGGNNFLELLTLSSYALVALRREDATATEAAMKYFVLGAMASGFLLYGLSMVYGATGSLDIGEVFKAVNSGQIRHQVLVFGVVLIAGAPKLAAFAIVMRLLVDALLPLAIDWQQMLAVLAVGSLLVGNLAAIAQTNLKRMLAYSTISQMGFVLLGLMSGVINGTVDAATAQAAYSASMFYVVTYVLTTLAAFGVILLLARSGFESDNIADMAGLNQRSPLYAGILAICLFSMAGVPPLVGFYSKLAVLQALVASGDALHIGLAVFAVMMSLIGAFYYLRVVKVMYFDAPVQTAVISAPLDVRVILTLNGALLFVLGILPGGLMALCSDAILRSLAS